MLLLFSLPGRKISFQQNLPIRQWIINKHIKIVSLTYSLQLINITFTVDFFIVLKVFSIDTGFEYLQFHINGISASADEETKTKTESY